jgi:hypothetical protein
MITQQRRVETPNGGRDPSIREADDVGRAHASAKGADRADFCTSGLGLIRQPQLDSQPGSVHAEPRRRGGESEKAAIFDVGAIEFVMTRTEFVTTRTLMSPIIFLLPRLRGSA